MVPTGPPFEPSSAACSPTRSPENWSRSNPRAGRSRPRWAGSCGCGTPPAGARSATPPARHHDHITPHAAGGPTSIDNGQGTCALCNQKERHLHHVTRETGDPDDPGAVTGTGETGASGDTGPGRSGRPGHRVTWTSRNGTTRTTTPTRLTPPATTPAQATAPRERSGAPRPPAQPEPGRPEPGRPEPGRPARPTTPVAPKAPPRGTALPEHLPPGVHRGTSHRDTRPRRSPGIRHRRGSSSDGDEDDSTDP